MKKHVLLISALFLASCSTATESPTDSNAPIVIGGIAPLTGGGAVYGLPVMHTANLAAEEINQAGGINGRELRIVWEDGKCNPKDASMAAQKLVNIDKVKVITGGVCTGEVLGFAPIADKKNVVLLLTGSQGEEIRHAGDYAFRISPAAILHSDNLANYANEQELNKVVFLTEQTDYAVSVEQTFTEKFKGEVQSEKFLKEDSDFKTILTKLKSQGDIDAFFINPQTIDKFTIIFKQIQELEWTVPLILNEAVAGNDGYFQEHADELDAYGASIVAAKFLYDHRPRYAEVYQKYLDKYEVEKIDFPLFLTTTYDGIYLLKQILEQVGEVNTDKIRDALYAIESYEGVSGTFSFDEDGEVLGLPSSFVQWSEGKFRRVVE